ncbi:MAG: VWA domain-containing protein, partial [Bryobacteraceae bacterium]|nr:VWA domain-containing protein [Bryobacteraceae bacterium]
RKFVAIAVDNSFSMRTGDRLAQAKQAALSALSGMGATDRGQIMTFSSSVQFLTQPTSDKAELQRAIQGIQPGDGRSAYGEVSRTLRSMNQPDGLPVEAHVISDMQLTSMPTPFAELAIPPSTKLQLHAVADKREPNWFVESVNAPRSIFQPKKVRIQAVVGGAGTPPGELPVELAINGKVLETKKVTLTESGRATLEFFLPEAAYGLNRGEIRIPAKDSLAADDRFPFSIERKESSRILIVHDSRSSRAATYAAAAIESVPDAGYTVESLTSDQASNVAPSKFSSVILSDVGTLPASLESALNEYVKQGGGVFVALGSSTIARGKVPLTGETIRDARYASREGERFLTAGQVDKTHPAAARAGTLDEVRFYQISNVTTDKSARIIAKLSDGTPLMYERKIGEGKVLVLTSTLDNVANDLPLHASFVPLMEQSAHYLSGFDPVPADYSVDSFAELRSARDAGSAVDVLDPDGKRAVSLKESAAAQSIRLSREGFWELRRANGRNELIAVHADRRESDLEVIPKETLALWQGTGSRDGTGGGTSDQTTKPYSLWWYFALALFAVSIAESIFASRYLAAERETGNSLRRAA